MSRRSCCSLDCRQGRDCPRRIFTRPTLAERINRSPAIYAALIFVALFALLGAAEIVCTLLGAAFDARIG